MHNPNDISMYLERRYIKGVLAPKTNSLSIDDNERYYDKLLNLTKMEPLNVDILDKLLKQGKPMWFNHRVGDTDFSVNQIYSNVIAKLILTNKDRTGMWLVDESDTGKVSIPGGHISKDDFLLTEDLNAMATIIETLTRETSEEVFDNGTERYENIGNYNIGSINRLRDILYSVGFTVPNIEDITMYYIYTIPNTYIQGLTFYMVIDVEPISPKGRPKNMIWLDKEEFRLSKYAKSSSMLQNIFGTSGNPNKDIRTSFDYRPILSAIFNTKEVF